MTNRALDAAGWPRALCGGGAVAGVPIPDSVAAKAAETLCREHCDWMLYAHTARSYLYAALFGRDQATRFDQEALFVACVLHDIGLTPAYDDPIRPFEFAGADVAVALPAVAGWPQPRRSNLHRAIVMHMATEVGDGESAEVRLLEAGVACDVTGHHLEQLGDDTRREILRRLPRGRFKAAFPALMQREATRKPHCAAAIQLRNGLADRIRRSPFHDTNEPTSPH